MNANNEKCPVCGNEQYVEINISGGGEYPPALYMREHGGVDLVACTKCGTVRLSKRNLDELNSIL